jgi:hypothetical protein
MPFWLKAVLGILAVYVAFSVILAVIHFVLSSVLMIAVGAAAIGLVWYGYRRFMNSLPAYKRRELRNKRDTF